MVTEEKETYLILVDEEDHEVAISPKLDAHIHGQLHRAVSVLVFNTNGEMLLQRRADSKYHSAGLWTNAACSHPAPGESALKAAARRLHEEMGLGCTLRPLFNFIYKASFDNGLIEHEYDHVYYGYTDIKPIPNPDEVSDYKYMALSDIEVNLTDNPDAYTVWFHILFNKLINEYKDGLK
jgi:isopentenyl-diphosphate delta-isomerase